MSCFNNPKVLGNVKYIGVAANETEINIGLGCWSPCGVNIHDTNTPICNKESTWIEKWDGFGRGIYSAAKEDRPPSVSLRVDEIKKLINLLEEAICEVESKNDYR